ncbi:ABC transporter substrate-binding protein [Paenibacillus aquistagni]|uniref:ABC transporter substrate-binding protein n=1 Tax=Paenibacillus aquistagni TaxID=1852522 RepID=UPI001F10E4F1|nr:extracellular solute-binding protein [Paenibacillus aquistagni]
MKRSLSVFLMVCMVFMMVLAGCSSNATDPVSEQTQAADQTDQKKVANEEGQEQETVQADKTTVVAYNGDPVTLKFIIAVDEETFNNQYRNHVEQKFPNIKLELVDAVLDRTGLQELNARGETPDMYVMHEGYEVFEELDMLEPLDPYIEQSNYDLSVFQDGAIDILRALDPAGTGQLYGFPYQSSQKALFYNKDIFDKFGVDYPTDGMTWDEIIEIAIQLTNEREGIKYKGLSFGYYSHAFSQLGVNGTDPKSGEVQFTKDPTFTQYFDLLDRYRAIPGMIDTSGYKYSFRNEQNLAMYVGQVQHLPLNARVEGLDFDMVTVPAWPNHPGVGPTAPPGAISINKHSKNKEAAWAVMAFLSSPEGQITLSRAGGPPIVKDEQVISSYAADIIEDSGREFNVTPIFNQKLAKVDQFSPFGPLITFHYDDYMNQTSKDFVKMQEKDVATFLREMEEEYAAIVKEKQAKQ